MIKGKEMSTEKSMMDAAGTVVPLKYVKAYDKQRDRVARRCLARWEKAREAIERVYADTEADLAEIEVAAAGGRTGMRGLGTKGNFQFMSFDGLIAVARSARYELSFDERLRMAQAMIEAIIKEKTSGIDADLTELLRNVFRPTSDGLLSQARVMGLFRLKIGHPKWAQAMELIRESIQSRKSKNLLSVKFKKSRDEEWESILLNVAAIAESEEEAK